MIKGYITNTYRLRGPPLEQRWENVVTNRHLSFPHLAGTNTQHGN